MKTVFENNVVKISRTDRDYDFIAVVENKTDKEVQIIFDNIDMEYNNFLVNANDWVGLLANNEGYLSLEELEEGRFIVV